MRLFYFFILETNSQAQERLRLKIIATDLGCFLYYFIQHSSNYHEESILVTLIERVIMVSKGVRARGLARY